MARPRPAPSKPSTGYLVSFGDTMTALLAFFIVLNSLAQDQTGANLHSGTGSFVAALNGVGTAGILSARKSENAFQMKAASPLYIVDDGADVAESGAGIGPDDQSNNLRVIEREREQLQRLLTELEQGFAFDEQSESSHQVSFDLFKSLRPPPDVLPVDAKQVIAQALPMLLRGNHRLEVAVWATMPGRTPIRKATEKAELIRAEIISQFVLDDLAAGRIQCSARLWPLSDEKRPVVTITVIRVDPKGR